MVHIAEADWTQGHYQILHRHEDFSEIFILLEGIGKYTIGGRLYELHEGDVVLCNQGVMHDEFPAKCDSYRTLAVGIGGLYIPELKPGLLIDPFMHAGSAQIGTDRRGPGALPSDGKILGTRTKQKSPLCP